jgi:hypothetical protein
MPRGNQTSVDPTETKREKFRRLANQRGRRVIASIEALGRLGTAGYEREPGDIERLDKAIGGALKSCLAKLLPRVAGQAAQKSGEDLL